MTNLSNDLKSYLSRNQRTEGESVLPLLSDEDSSSSGFSWLPYSKTKQTKSCLPQLSAKQRAVGFGLSLSFGVICLTLAGLCIPVLVLKARKFALLVSLANGSFLTSLCCIFGPGSFLSSLVSAPRLPATVLLVLSLGAALYSALHLQSALLTLICLGAQAVALVWLLMASVPGGQSGLKMMLQLFKGVATQTVNRTLPV